MIPDRNIRSFKHCSPHINASLLRYGCIGSAPIKPTVAITIRTLAVYRQTHRVCPRLSIHAEAKKLCHMHHVRYHRYLADQLRIAYDVYLELYRRIDQRINVALKHNTPDWRMLNSCPACQYKVQDEPKLKFSLLCAMDGNSSAKLVDPAIRGGTERPDPRDGKSAIWLSEEYVNTFRDEVRDARVRQAAARSKKKPTNPATTSSDSQPNRDPDDPWIPEPDTEDAAEPTDVCVDRWRNAAPESRKKMFAIFRKSGIFITVCRHGFLLTICDMVRSGELMKYPLASVKKLLDVFGDDILYGYDIECALDKLLQRCSFATQVKAKRCVGCVPAFHGFGHNRYCQLYHHSKYKIGAGKEDFESCERVFAETNALAPETRNATEFHRHQAYDEHFVFMDMDKYASLSTFIYNNYIQALSIISTATAFLSTSQDAAGLRPEDWEADLEDERKCLQRLHDKKGETTTEVDYLDLRTTGTEFTRKAVGDIKRRHTYAANKRDQKQQVVEDYEQQMGIEERWSVDLPERIQAQSRITNKLFHKAVDDVERLVVMRLLELTKLQMSGLGYKLRTQISNALKSRAPAIRNALGRYNKYAELMNPPRPSLKWEQIVEFSFLAEFDLLRETDEQIHSKRWANPSYRLAAVQYYDLQRAKEEIDRCNVEVLRLLTRVRDDAIDMPKAISALESTDHNLSSELRRRWKYTQSINAYHIQRIQQIQALPGYSGPMRADLSDEGDHVDPSDEAEDSVGQQMMSMEDFIGGLGSHITDAASLE
ncbi:hypothetical protein BJ138DRAFT_1203757 [Hygrophoropsis aurantiaca]|uniref:Uncharacterized protein n=1 Tax=Hygrophoropsis aurantiaca TaxID=72124 RepID=A0ACB8A5S5_9AGAM|nr:hypothetical protein BJ138DRAFT_1203757 [Hygrophoropsis aurantiaca]